MEPNDTVTNDLWPPDPPDPAAWVNDPPWDRWKEPDRWWGPDDWRGEQEQEIATWFFSVGMILWEIQEGFHRPEDVRYYLPPARWWERARAWFDAAGAPAPRRGHKRKAAWQARQAGVASMREALGERAEETPA